MKDLLSKAVPVVFSLTVALGAVEIWEGSSRRVVHAAEGTPGSLSMTCSDVCSATGCTVEYTVLSKGNKTYVQAKYVKKSEVLGHKVGDVTESICDWGQGTVTTLDQANHTYTTRKDPKLASLPLATLLKELASAKDAKEFVGKKTQHGTMFTFQTVSTTVSDAAKDAKIDETKLSVPKDYTEAKAVSPTPKAPGR